MHSLVLGGGGFIGSHLVRFLKERGHQVTAVDLVEPAFHPSEADEFIQGDLRQPDLFQSLAKTSFDRVYQLAADMGGAGYIFTGDHDADIIHNSALINLNLLDAFKEKQDTRIFFSSSACVYPQQNQENLVAPVCREDTVYPAHPDSDYGWEKLFSERMFMAYQRNYNLDIRVARFHNIFGPFNVFSGGREKAPAAICRKVAQAADGDVIEIWGDGRQTRSFLYIDECLEGVEHLMNSEFPGPVNIGSDEMISINDLAKMVIDLSGKDLSIRNVRGPMGVRGRNSDNRLIFEKLNWRPNYPLQQGMEKLYSWVNEQVAEN
jgi:nucleoside-diphosphate-sugar epimerase